MSRIDDTMKNLPNRFRPEMAGAMQATVQFHFTGPDGGLWMLAIEGGQCIVHPGQANNPDATVTMAASDFVGINAGQISAPDIFWSGRIHIQGDVETVIALAPIMDWQ
jgi:predicted lipid carrier protein YhbT